MNSPLECFQHAARYEEMAKRAADRQDEKVLLAMAQRWRKLGEAAKAKETMVPTADPAPPRMGD